MRRHHLLKTSLCVILIVLIGLANQSSSGAIAGPALIVNAAAGQKPISPYIYGINFANAALAAELHFPVNRYGGNATTRYNWQNDTSNRASDWYFENIPNDNANPGALPNGSASDQFVDQDQSTTTKSIITVPLIGWAPKDRVQRCGFSVALYGAQQSTDPWMPDCGNGLHTNGSNVTGNNPTDTSVAIGPSFVQGWVNHLIGRYGTAANGGVLFYNLDNEPDLWCFTHRDVHPGGATYDEMRDLTYAYGAAIKATDPGAKTLGPVGWGFNSLLYSGGDQCAPGSWWANPPDRNAHGGVPFGDWYLQQMAAYEQAHSLRILDYFDNHFYPQGNGVALAPAGDAATQALRLRSTRSLWDSTYNDESWINQVIQFIPRMKTMITTNYPGTKTAITEYNWGALDNINGALAQADVLGIFGREGLDLATLWAGPANTEPGAYAFRMYLNYDGAGGKFGSTSVSASSADQSKLAIYASTRTDGKLLLTIINKEPSSDLTSTVSLSGFNPTASALVYRYSQANLNAIVPQANQAVTSTGFTATFPAYSITLMVLSPSSAPVVRRVTKLADTNDGVCNTDCSLREAIAISAANDTINFVSGLTGTITLNSPLAITRAVKINGPGANLLTISGNNAVRVFTISAGAAVTLNKLGIANGNAGSGNGGAIHNAGNLILVYVSVANSTTTGLGGGIFSSGVLTVNRSVISGNSAPNGSAVYNQGATFVLNNSTVSGNSGPGSAIYNNGTTVRFTNATVASNTGTGLNNPNVSGKIYLKNSIVANNTVANCAGIITNNGFNLQNPAMTCGATITRINPKLGPLANNGGPTLTMRLAIGSPALDAGDNATCASLGNVDQRGVVRPVDGNGDGTLVCDIGAFESPLLPPPPTPAPAIPTFVPVSGSR
jgi:CSLREA domain-containing protein